MKHIVRLLLALILCGCVVLFPVRAQTIDPAAEVEQYFAGEDMTAVKDAIPPEVAEQMEQQGISSFSKLISMPVTHLRNIWALRCEYCFRWSAQCCCAALSRGLAVRWAAVYTRCFPSL